MAEVAAVAAVPAHYNYSPLQGQQNSWGYEQWQLQQPQPHQEERPGLLGLALNVTEFYGLRAAGTLPCSRVAGSICDATGCEMQRGGWVFTKVFWAR